MKKTALLLFIFSLLIAGTVTSSPAPQLKEEAFAANSRDNRISRAQLKVYSYVHAGYGEYFAFDGLKVNVAAYTLLYMPGHGDPYIENVQGNKLSSSARARFANAKPGDKVIISQAKVKGDFGERYLQSPLYTIY